jgi:hypothetical protein
MASSFIRYKDNGFWIKDPIMEITLSYICKVFEPRKNVDSWTGPFYTLLYTNSLGHFPSYMHLDLDEYLITQERKNFFLNILNETEDYLKGK